MRNIVLARIDDRLIHGQIVTSWCKSNRAQVILIADDKLTQDNFTQRLLRAAAPPDIRVEIKTVEEAANYLLEEDPKQERIILLTKIPQTMRDLITRNVQITSINLGGMGAKAGRSRLNKNISASPEEVECLKELMQKGIDIYYQLIPADHATNLKNILKGER